MQTPSSSSLTLKRQWMAGIGLQVPGDAILDAICRDLELTPTQLEAARTSYEFVAKWLAGGDDPIPPAHPGLRPRFDRRIDQTFVPWTRCGCITLRSGLLQIIGRAEASTLPYAARNRKQRRTAAK
jgi:hypothetical protein